MKKILSVFITAVIAVGCLSACGSTRKQSEATEPIHDNLKIVTTIFPLYDWVNEILGDDTDAKVTLLLDNSIDLHSYQPTAEDILEIADCDLFIYVGGESDEWVDGVLGDTVNEDRITLNLIDILGDRAKQEETVEGMQSEENDDESEYDEHIWLSLRNAQVICSAIADALISIDSDNSDTYSSNAEAYNKKLSILDGQYKTVTENAPIKTLIFGDRFPFRYMTDDYGLEYYAAFKGCSAETEASFETISFLSQKLDELGLITVMTIEGSDHKIASTIAAASQAKTVRIMQLNSMQSTTSADIENGASYVQIMKDNLEVLRQSLK